MEKPENASSIDLRVIVLHYGTFVTQIALLTFLWVAFSTPFQTDRESCMRKTATLNLRIRPEIKIALERLAEREGRSLTGLVEWLVMERCAGRGIDVQAIVDELKTHEKEAV